MKTKRVFSLTSLFLAGAAVCGCQNTNPTPPIRQQAWPTTQTSQVRTTQPGMMTQNGSMTPNGMGMQTGVAGSQQYQNTGVTSGIPSNPYNNLNTTGGYGTPTNPGYPGTSTSTTTKFGPTSSLSPGGVQQGSFNTSMAGADMGGVNVTQTQCPPGSCPTCDTHGMVPPPPTQTLPSGLSGRPFGG
jgi:hypothetical protein